MTQPEKQRSSQPRMMLALAGLVIASLLAALDQSITATAAPRITAELGHLNLFTWITTAYVLAASISTPLIGKLGDLYGRKTTFLASLSLFLLGSLLCGLAPTMPLLIVFRVLQGIGGGGLIVSTNTAFAELFPQDTRARYQGWFTAAFAVASVAGPLLGGFVTDQWHWRWAFYLNLPLGLLSLTLGLFALHLPHTNRHPRIDFPGMALLGLITTLLLLFTHWGGQAFAWVSWPALGLVLLIACLVAVWLQVERRAPEPIIPLYLFRHRAIALSNLVTFLSGFALFGGVLFIPLYLQFVTGASATRAGMQLLPLTVGLLIVSLAGPLIQKLGELKWAGLAGMLAATLGAALLTLVNPHTPAAFISAALFLLGSGLGLVMQVYTLTVLGSMPPRDFGSGMSTSIFARQMGGSLGLAVFGAIFNATLVSQLAQRIPSGQQATLPSPERLVPEVVSRLPADMQSAVISSYASAVSAVFQGAALALLIGSLLATLHPRVNLKPQAPQGGKNHEPA